MKLLVVIPAFNEEKNIRKTIESVFRNSQDLDILVVNDGSSDNTVGEVLITKAILVSLPYNSGYGVAIQTGYKYALENNYDVVVQLDADGQHDPKYVSVMVDTLKDNNLDVVVGSRFLGKNSYHAPLTRRIGMIFFSMIVSFITGRKVTDSTSGYQAIDRKVLKFLCSDYFPNDFPDADLLIMLHFANFNVMEVPMRMYESNTGQSMHGGITKNIYYVSKICLSIFTIILRKISGLPNS